MKKIMSLCLFTLLFSLFSAEAQTILTAKDFFNSVSDTYASIKDYEASISITAGSKQMSGHVSFKRPDLLRIDFSNPADQVILFNGEDLTIYLPGSSAVLNQSSTSGTGSANLATPQGLSMMKRYYTIAYVTGQDPVPLSEGSDEMVVKLILNRRSTSEAFRTIELSVLPQSKLIRRVVAMTPQGTRFEFSFSNYSLNQNIPDQRFIYDAPSSANNYNNFLLSE